MATNLLWNAAAALQIASNKVMHASAACKATTVLSDALSELHAAGSELARVTALPDAQRFSSEEEAPRIPKARGVPTIPSNRTVPVPVKTRAQIEAEIVALQAKLGE